MLITIDASIYKMEHKQSIYPKNCEILIRITCNLLVKWSFFTYNIVLES